MNVDQPATPPGLGFDPADCDRIPIHIPSLIQPHGAILVLRPNDYAVVQSSTNTDRWLGVAVDELLGKPVADVIGAAEANRLRLAIGRERLDAGPRFALTLPARGSM